MVNVNNDDNVFLSIPNENRVTFTNDNNVSLLIPKHKYSQEFSERDNHEIIFRKINTFLINNKIIKNNIIDLGAYIGDNTIPWAKNINSTIYAIDPSPSNCEFISKVANLNKINNIKILQTAISDKNEILESSDHDLHHVSFVYRSNRPFKHTQTATTLDLLYQNNEINNIGYIHLDVEGMEFKVLKGSVEILNQFNPIITFEQHTTIDNVEGIKKFLKEKEYKIFMIDEILPGCRSDCRNFIAFPSQIFNESLIKDIHSYIGGNILLLQ